MTKVHFGALTTAEGWKYSYDPIFLQNVFFISITKPQKMLAEFKGFLPP